METIDLKLTPEHLDVIVKSLAEIPYKFSAPVLQELRVQIEAQKKDK